MKRGVLLTITLLVTLNFSPSPNVRSLQTDSDKLPNPEDFPEAGAVCKRRVKVSPWVGTPGVDWPNTFRCVLVIHTCEGVKRFTSGVRNAGAGMCDDYWRVHNELAQREICCGPPSRKSEGSPSRKPEEDYPEARRDCKNPQRLIVDTVQRVPVPPGNQIKCQLTTRACSVTKTYESLPRQATPNACIDYEATAARLLGRMVCCDPPEETRPCQNYSGEIACDCDADGQDESIKQFESCGIPANWPATFKSRCEDWVRPDGSIGYGTDVGIQRQGSAWLEYTLKCPALKCRQVFAPCKQRADNAYER